MCGLVGRGTGAVAGASAGEQTVQIVFEKTPVWKQPSVHLWMNEQNVVHPYSGISLSHREERSSDMCSNLDEP